MFDEIRTGRLHVKNFLKTTSNVFFIQKHPFYMYKLNTWTDRKQTICFFPEFPLLSEHCLSYIRCWQM